MLNYLNRLADNKQTAEKAITMAQILPGKKINTGGARNYSRPVATPEIKNVVPPEQDNWLDRSPEALAAVQRGLADSAAGRGVKMSFLEFADADIDDGTDE